MDKPGLVIDTQVEEPAGASKAPAEEATPRATAATANALRALFETVTNALAAAGLGGGDVPPPAPAPASEGSPQPPAASPKQQHGTADSAAQTLSEIAGIISAMAKEGNLGELLTHPGAATIGVYYLARRHQMERLVERLDGSHVGDAECVHDLIRYTDLSDSVYPDRYSDIVERGHIVKPEDILYHNRGAEKLQPGFYIARDPSAKKIVWVVRGSQGVQDVLGDLCGTATPLPGGGYAHWGMWRSALWLMDNHLERVIDALADHPGYDLVIVGHSMGAGVGALVALVLNTNEEIRGKLRGARVECACIAPAACMSPDLASSCGDYVISLVMRYDLVPRFSSHSVEELRRELLGVDYRSLLAEDIMGNEAVRKAIDATIATAQRIKAQERAQAALAQARDTAARVAATVASNPKVQAFEKIAQDQVQALEKIAQEAAESIAHAIDDALAKPPRAAGEPAAAPGSPAAERAESAQGAEGAAAAPPAAGAVAAAVAAAALGARVASATKETAAAAAGAALQAQGVRDALGWVSQIMRKAAAARVPATEGAGAGAAAAAALPAEGALSADRGEKGEKGLHGPEASVPASAGTGREREEAEEAAAAGQLVNVPLYAPGRIFWLRPVDDSLPEDQHRFELVDAGTDARFQRIVLRASCLSDHFPRSARAALADVLATLKTPQDAEGDEAAAPAPAGAAGAPEAAGA